MNVTLRARRLELDLTHVELAQKAQVSSRTISRAEAGHPIRPLQQQRIARAVGLTRQALFGPMPGEEAS